MEKQLTNSATELCLDVEVTNADGVRVDELCLYPAHPQLISEILHFLRDGYTMTVQVVHFEKE